MGQAWIRATDLGSLSVPDAIAVPFCATDDGPAPCVGQPESVGGLKIPSAVAKEWAERQGFCAAVGQVLSLRASRGPVLHLIGIGDDTDAESWRQFGAAAVRAAGTSGTLVMLIPDDDEDELDEIAEAVATGAGLAGYRFEHHRSSEKPGPVDAVFIAAFSAPADDIDVSVKAGRRIAEAVCFARDLINEPPATMTPQLFARAVVDKLKTAQGVSTEVWEEGRIVTEQLGGLLGVARGSSQPPRLIMASYAPKNPAVIDGAVPHVVLVGKGVTFDSGGMSLKTAAGMTTMKTDMTGAAEVMAIMSVLGRLDVGVQVTAIAPLTENMPGSKAIKPGDVLTARNGTTMEVLNTDAEGRLILADALCLAVEMNPDFIIDIATLTGAQVVALGTQIGALFSSDQALGQGLMEASGETGEALWPMPLPQSYRNHIDSEIADIKNIGKAGEAGSISAALFLKVFVGSVPWAHLDIAGPGRSDSDKGYLAKGGTAFGMRAVINFLRNLA